MDRKYTKPKLRRSFDTVYADDGIIFRSGDYTIKFKSNHKFIQEVITLLNGKNTLEQIIALLSDYKKDDINQCIDLLAQHNLIEESDEHRIASSLAFDNNLRIKPQLEFFKDISIDVDVAVKKMRESKIAIFGLGAHGAALALALANEGVGHIKCLDPSLVSNQDPYLCSITYQEKDVGKRKEDAFFEHVKNIFPLTKFEMSNLQKVTKQDIEKFISDPCDLAVCCIDKGFSSIYTWLNEAALKKSLLWLAANIEGAEAVIGPMIIPGESACYMCYKMRAAANEKSYKDAMIYYDYLDNNEKDELYRRSNVGISAGIIGNFVAAEVMKALIGLGSHLIGKTSLPGNICVINFMNMTIQFHKILKRPDCPHCGLKKNNNFLNAMTQQQPLLKRKDDDYYSTTTSSKQGPLLLQIESDLVSSKVGIIKSINRLQKDDSEPAIPHVFEVSLSSFIPGNYHDISGSTSNNFLCYCSGKGLTLQEAKISALGNAIERYCASQYDDKKITFAAYKQLVKDNIDVINPSLDLVLYSDEQYNSGLLPYARFSEDAVIGWVEGQSLITNKKILIPAIAVYLYYKSINRNNEFLLPPYSTTGLATGSTRSEAILNALLEVIERDAFTITWLCNLPMPKVDLNSIIQNSNEKGIKDIVNSYKRRNVTININALLLDTKNIPTFMVTAIDTSGKKDCPAAVVGLASNPDPEAAILKAILEVGQNRQNIKRKMRNANYINRHSIIRKFENIERFEDHALLYTDPEMLHAFDFLLHNGSGLINAAKICDNNISAGESSAEQLTYCINCLRKIGVDAISVDVTTDDISALGLFVARVFVTGFQPIHFGFNDKVAKLGGGVNSRLFNLPQRLGFYDHRLSIKELNPFPHPFGGTT